MQDVTSASHIYLGDQSFFMYRGGREKYGEGIKIYISSPPHNPGYVISKWPPFFIKYLDEDPPSPHISS